jgi:hypothetical protein
MTYVLCDERGDAGGDSIRVYVLSVFHQAVSIRHDSMEELFIWLHKKTNASCFRDAMVIIFNLDNMTDDDMERAKLAKKLYMCCCDGRIKPKVNVFNLYEDIAALRQGDLLA